MLPGFNHNIRHEGLLFHVQTEDNGLKLSSLVTQVFIDGHLLAIEKSSYREVTDGDLSKEARDEEIRTRMQNQHKELLRQVVTNSYAEQVQVYLKSQGQTPPTDASDPAPAAPDLPAGTLDDAADPNATLIDSRPVSMETQDDNDSIARLFDHFLSSVDAEVARHSGSLPRVQNLGPRDPASNGPATQREEAPLPSYPAPTPAQPPAFPPPSGSRSLGRPPVEPPLSGDQPTLPAEPARRRRVPLTQARASQSPPSPEERRNPTDRMRRIRRRPNIPRGASGTHANSPDETMLEMDAGALRRSLLEQRAKLRSSGAQEQDPSEDVQSLDNVLLRYLNESD